jgi:hypothetical protein
LIAATRELGERRAGAATVRLAKSWVNVLVVGLALIIPPVLVLVLHYTLGEGDAVAERVGDVAVIGPVVSFVRRVILGLYFPSFLVTGGVDTEFAILGLYLLLGLYFLIRRRWISAAIVVVAPLVCTWILSAKLLGD